MKKIKVPKDVRKKESKFKFFTFRQWIAVILAAALPFFLNRQMLLLRVGSNIRNGINYTLVGLLAGFGFFTYKGMKFEKLILRVLEYFFGSTVNHSKKEGDLLDNN